MSTIRFKSISQREYEYPTRSIHIVFRGSLYLRSRSGPRFLGNTREFQQSSILAWRVLKHPAQVYRFFWTQNGRGGSHKALGTRTVAILVGTNPVFSGSYISSASRTNAANSWRVGGRTTRGST